MPIDWKILQKDYQWQHRIFLLNKYIGSWNISVLEQVKISSVYIYHMIKVIQDVGDTTILLTRVGN